MSVGCLFVTEMLHRTVHTICLLTPTAIKRLFVPIGNRSWSLHRSFSVGDWAGLNGLGGEAEELATRAYAPELLTLTLHRSGSAAFREGGQARYGFLSTLLRLPKELSLSGKRSLSNASWFQDARRKVTQLRHGVYAALLLAKANGRQLSGHRSRGRERPRA